ncbi:toxin [filamentous cyanobacterium CCP2]|nr:toxin [filamentous cyanobacterium CCP2]
MEFEFDLRKSHSNLQKHGIDFREAQQLRMDVDRVKISARTEDEARFLVIGRIGGKHWSAVITYRAERIRLISVRRSRTEEVEIYESGSI